MMLNFAGKKALVTGASSGIGKQCAIELLECGATVTIASSSAERLAEAAADMNSEVQILQCDLRDEKQTECLVDRASELMGGLDILVCNAGITADQLTVRAKMENWHKVVQVNLTASYILNSKACLRFMKQRRGRIVNISSVVASTGNIGQANYCASKGGLEAMTRALAIEFASRNIGINCVAPGFIDTDMTRKMSVDAINNVIQRIPMIRQGHPSDVAKAVLFLCSEEASGYITGQVIHVNGGLRM